MMRARALALLTLLLAGPAQAQAPPPLPMREVAPGVLVFEAPYALARPDNDGAIANVGFIVGAEAVAVIDTGGSLRAGRRLLAAIRDRTRLPIRYVVNTHMHPDHVLGNAAFAGVGARFVGHHKLARALGARAEVYLDSARRELGEAAAGTELVPPDLTVEGRLTLDLGEREIEVEAHPTAHTDNDLTVLDRRTGTWFLGDLLFIGHVPTLDGRLTGWLTMMDGSRGRTIARVVPGHGPASAPWPEALLPQERYLRRIEAEVRALVRAGRGIEEAAANVGLSERDAWSLFDAFNARNAMTAFKELEWE